MFAKYAEKHRPFVVRILSMMGADAKFVKDLTDETLEEAYDPSLSEEEQEFRVLGWAAAEVKYSGQLHESILKLSKYPALTREEFNRIDRDWILASLKKEGFPESYASKVYNAAWTGYLQGHQEPGYWIGWMLVALQDEYRSPERRREVEIESRAEMAAAERYEEVKAQLEAA